MTLESNTATDGQLEVHIVKDIVFATDETKKLCGSKVSLEAGLNEVPACEFVADQLTPDSLRHYFLKVQWNGDFIHDPLDNDTREAVFTDEVTISVVAAQDAEFQTMVTAVSSMMVDNSLATLLTPSALASGSGTGGCDTGTTLMTAFPDTSTITSGDKLNDPGGTAYADGVDPLGDLDGFLLFGHDITGDDDQGALVNYMSVGSTAFCYQTASDGTITQFDKAGFLTNP